MGLFTALRTILLLGAALCYGGAAEAATQGSLGATSSGSIAISLSVAGRVQISGLSDVAFVAVSPDAAALSAQNVCVWSNTSTKGYTVTATGDGTANAFTLAGPGTPMINVSTVALNGSTVATLTFSGPGTESGSLKGYLAYEEEELVSADFKGNPYSSIVDAKMTLVVGGNCVKVISWYDNEWGYSCRVRDLINYMASKGL